ncbi:MAG: hypothetical protein JOZ37_03555 [Actinobacteria bacterium]|nr:hypothetical protein [Actinomycetota bacterium]MBV9663019.1 hypothetical protein [Actinomycetota bacterium]
MRRMGCVVIAVLTLLSGCSSSSKKVTAANGTSSTATQHTLSTAGGTSGACGGLGAADPAGSVTYVENNKLYAVSTSGGTPTCLDADVGSGAPRWNGDGDKVILPDGRVDRGQGPQAVTTGNPLTLSWSYPHGTAVLQVDQSGKLSWVPSGGGAPLDITFLARHDAAIYHPAGTHIVSSGLSKDGTYGLFVATNRGQDVRMIVRSETANSIGQLAWTTNHQLLFVADHGDHKDLHQFNLATEKLVTVTQIPASQCFRSVVASRSPGGGVAWSTGACDGSGPAATTAVRSGAFLPLAGTPLASAQPIGFLPDGTLIGRGSDGVVAFKAGTVSVLHSANAPTALRVPEPASPPIELAGIPAVEARAPA